MYIYMHICIYTHIQAHETYAARRASARHAALLVASQYCHEILKSQLAT